MDSETEIKPEFMLKHARVLQMLKLSLRPLAIFHFNFDSLEVDITEKLKKKMEPQTPASLTTLFDLKVKQQVTNNTIFQNATQVFDHKLGKFKQLYS